MKRIARMTNLINLKATGNPDEFSRKIGVGKTRLAELIKIIRDTGIPLSYDRNKQTYYFDDEVEYVFQCRFIVKY